MAYLFKHIVTQEVAYESLAYATRAQLHEQLAQYLEGHMTGGAPGPAPLDLLAFHYGRSANIVKQREYLRKAGDAAQAAYANAAALDYYDRLFPLLSEPGEQIEIHLKRGQVLQLVGDWAAAETAYRSAFELAQQSGSARAQAQAQFALGALYNKRGDYPLALACYDQARAGWQALGESAEMARAVARGAAGGISA
ncbi:MAG: tetratricopeptide repeat protein [Anaerolineae bacterium]